MHQERGEQDMNSYIDTLLGFNSMDFQGEKPFLGVGHKDETLKVMKPQSRQEIFHSIPQREPQLPQPIITRKTSQSSGSESYRPKDYLKNMYNNSLKFIVKRYISQKYKKRVEKLLKKFRVQDPEDAKLYYRSRQQQTIGLTNLCNLLNFRQGSETEKRYKKAFHAFYVWFMRRQYPIHIIKTGKLQHQEVYWRAKNILIYLPELRNPGGVLPPCLTETPSISLTEISLPVNNSSC